MWALCWAFRKSNYLCACSADERKDDRSNNINKSVLCFLHASVSRPVSRPLQLLPIPILIISNSHRPPAEVTFPAARVNRHAGVVTCFVCWSVCVWVVRCEEDSPPPPKQDREYARPSGSRALRTRAVNALSDGRRDNCWHGVHGHDLGLARAAEGGIEHDVVSCQRTIGEQG
jgi:hypothetical protein